MKEESGAPLRSFLEEVPNDGLIKYTHLLNKERVLGILFAEGDEHKVLILLHVAFDTLAHNRFRDNESF
jgi:hypothetical protein